MVMDRAAEGAARRLVAGAGGGAAAGGTIGWGCSGDGGQCDDAFGGGGLWARCGQDVKTCERVILLLMSSADGGRSVVCWQKPYVRQTQQTADRFYTHSPRRSAAPACAPSPSRHRPAPPLRLPRSDRARASEDTRCALPQAGAQPLQQSARAPGCRRRRGRCTLKQTRSH